MKSQLVSLLTALTLSGTLGVRAQGTAFTYQGQLHEDANPANGSYDLRFTIYDSAGGPTVVAGPLINSPVGVTNGLFTVTLDFGSGVFTGPPRWLEIAVKSNGVAGPPTTLSPRQRLTATPYAMTSGNLTGSLPASQLTGTLPSGALSGTYSQAVTFNNSGNSFSGNGAGLSGLNAWGLTGNSGTVPGTQFLGTTDNQPLDLRVNSQRALRLEPSVGVPNVIGGSRNNSAGASIEAATIAGGGLDIYPNRVTASYAAIGGGTFNTASGEWATIAGGRDGTASGGIASVGGGYANMATGYVATVAGGVGNLAGGTQSAVAGGSANKALGDQSVVAGGSSNLAYNPGTFVGGGNNNTALYYNAAVMGGDGNTAVQNYSAIGGGLQNTNQSLGGFIGGGYTNYAEGRYVTVGGGAFDRAASDFTTIGGGYANVIGTNAQSATIAGGENNRSDAVRSTVGGGWLNTIGLDSWEAVLAGGSANTIRSNAPFSVVSGGRWNVIGAHAWLATVPGGEYNEANGSLSLAAGFRAKANHTGAFVWADSSDADFGSTANDQFLIRANGGLGINTTATAAGMVSVAGRMKIEGDSSHTQPSLELHETQDGDYARIQLQVANRPFWHVSVGGADNSLYFYNSTNSIVASLSESGVLTTRVLTITGGADIAEPFKMSEPNLPKGAVVVIDPEHPGALKLSTEPYDRKVAGIVSGAGGINPGLSLSQQGMLPDGQAVALTGRVYVQADAAGGAIAPGDLLTTSPTPGYAMKVTDHARAQGAILGKAMTGLSAGQGLVLVLVTLQ